MYMYILRRQNGCLNDVENYFPVAIDFFCTFHSCKLTRAFACTDLLRILSASAIEKKYKQLDEVHF